MSITSVPGRYVYNSLKHLYLIASVEAVMLLVNLQLATTSTAVDDFQPVIEVAVTNDKKMFKTTILNT